MNATPAQHTSPSAIIWSLGQREYALAFTCLVACRLLAAIPCHLYDDAFITMRYAQNLAAGHGFVYNPGAPWEPVLGTTTPAYTLVLAAAAWGGADVSVFAVAFNAVCDGLIACLILRSLQQAAPLGGLLAAGLFAATPLLNRISAGGMESPLFVLSALAAFHLDDRRQHVRAGMLAALSALVRPEGVLTMLVLVLRNWRNLRVLACSVVPPISLGLVYLVIATAYFGSPIPQSVLAKARMQVTGWGPALVILRWSFAASTLLAVALPITLVGVWSCMRSAGLRRSYSLWALLLTGAYVAARPMVWSWYFYPVLTANCLWLGTGLALVLGKGLPRLQAALATGGTRALPIGVYLVCALGTGGFAIYLGPSPVRSGIYAAMRGWACKSVPLNASILAHDIGAIGYYSGARILDSAGLVWPVAVNTDQMTLIRENRPDYVLLTAVRSNVEAMQSDADLRPCYTPVARFNATDDKSLWPTSDSLPSTWRQDYILYARKNTSVTSTNSATRMPHE
jgi:hypothetical protein